LQACGSDHSNGTICIFGWCGSGNRYDDVTESEPIMFVTVLLPYSIFRFVRISRFVIFLIGCQSFCGSPTNSLPGLAFAPAPQMDRCSSLPCRGPVTRWASLFGTELCSRGAQRFRSKFNTSKRPSNSTTLLLPNFFDHHLDRDHRSVDRPSPRSLFFPFLAVAVHISMSQTNQRYTSHRRGDSAAVNFFSAIQTRDENILSIEGSNSDLWMPFLL